MSEALRFNEGKPKLGYFARSFPKMLEAVARIKEFGAIKYDEGNWRKGNKPDAEYLDSAARHLDKFLAGEEHDQDSGCHHLGHMVWNLSALLELNRTKVPAIDAGIFREQVAYWQAKKAEQCSHSDADVDPMVDPEHRKAQGLPPLEGKLKLEVNGEVVAGCSVPINTDGINTTLEVDFASLPSGDVLFIGGGVKRAEEKVPEPEKFDRDGYYIEGQWMAGAACYVGKNVDETQPDTGFFIGGEKVFNINPASIKFTPRNRVTDIPVDGPITIDPVTVDAVMVDSAEMADLFAGGEPPKIVKEAPIQFVMLDGPRVESFEALINKYFNAEAAASLHAWDVAVWPEQEQDPFEKTLAEYFGSSAETSHRDAWGMEI